MPLFPYHTDSLLDMITFLDLINHGNGIVRIADDALSLAVKRQLLTAEDVPAAAFAVSLEVSGRTDIGSLHILSLTKLGEGLRHGRCQRLERIREIGTVRKLCAMLGIDIKAARAANNEKTGIRAGKDVAKV